MKFEIEEGIDEILDSESNEEMSRSDAYLAGFEACKQILYMGS